MSHTELFRQQMEAMYERLEQLYANAGRSPTPPVEMLPLAYKELGVAAEELQVAMEEMQQQNEQMASSLQQAANECEYYRNLFDCAPEAQLVTTPEGKILEANRAVAKLLGISKTALLGKLLVTFVPSELRSSFRSQLNRLPQSLHNQTWSVCLQLQKGESLELTLTTSAVRSDNGLINLHWVLRETPQIGAIAKENDTPDLSPIRQQKSQSQPPGKAELLENYTLHAFHKGETIPLSQQTLWRVHQGLVKLSTLTESNEEVLLGLAGPLISFGIGSIFLPVYQATAFTDVHLAQISTAEIKASPSLAQMLLLQCNQRLQQAESLLMIAGQRRVKDRLYQLLRLLKEEVGQSTSEGICLSVRLTHEDLASACCTTRVTVTRLLGELQRQNKISLNSKYHIVLKENF